MSAVFYSHGKNITQALSQMQMNIKQRVHPCSEAFGGVRLGQMGEQKELGMGKWRGGAGVKVWGPEQEVGTFLCRGET